jgi:hypothetical protein
MLGVPHQWRRVERWGPKRFVPRPEKALARPLQPRRRPEAEAQEEELNIVSPELIRRLGMIGRSHGMNGRRQEFKMQGRYWKIILLTPALLMLVLLGFFAWKAIDVENSQASRYIGTFLIGAGLLLDMCNLWFGISTVRGSYKSPVSVLPFLGYFYGAILLCKQWLWWGTAGAIVGGALLHAFCAWGIVSLFGDSQENGAQK